MPGFDILDPSLDLKRNYFIEASAGTGKTFTIENTVVRLIQEGMTIDKILVVTFTRAATLELKTRIRRNLAAKQLKKELLAFDEARIFTIHGFCFYTLKKYALETGFLLNQVEESGSFDLLNRILKDFLRTELTPEEIHPKQLEGLMRLHQNDLAKLRKELLSPLDDEGRSFSSLLSEINIEKKQLGMQSQGLYEELLSLANRFGKMCDRKKEVKAEIREGLLRAAQVCSGESQEFFELPLIQMTPDNLLKNKGPYPEILERLNQKLIPLLSEVSNPRRALSYLKFRFRHFLSHVCEQEDLFFYDDLLKGMRRCVEIPPFVEKVRAEYQAVLIDEFQDTDQTQWEIFSTLFLGHLPLYLVGDPKQSIYRFRGADLYTYMEAKTQMGGEAFTTLTRNFRATPRLVHALNALFGRTSTLIQLPKLNQTIPILPILAAQPETQEGGVILCQADDESTLFSYIAHEIERLHQTKGTKYGACAVLVKDHNQAKRFCAQCPLPFVTKKCKSLKESEAFFILEDLLMAVYNPRERSLLAKVIGGPLFRVPLDKLAKGVEEKMERFYHYHLMLQAEGILPFFKKLAREATFPNGSFYLDLLQLVELIAEHTHSFEEYLPFINKLKQEDLESEKMKARAQCTQDAIQVMTTHVSKGLEFEIVFPVSLICPQDMDDPEERSEKMRQLYVALTRAKKWLYFPLAEKENTPSFFFMNQVLNSESLESFVHTSPYFSLVHCTKHTPSWSAAIICRPSIKSEPSLSFPPSSIYSYSSLAEKKEHAPIQCPPHLIPPGAEMGILLHKIFERLDFQMARPAQQTFLASQLQGTLLEPWLEAIGELVEQALHFPLPAPSGEFCLADVDPYKIKREMEFLYPSDVPKGFIKGFIDLFFEYQGRYYIVDWKSNFLENYTPEKLEEACLQHDYHLQAELYQTAALKYLNLFQAREQLESIFYVFLRGLEISTKSGIYSYATR